MPRLHIGNTPKHYRPTILYCKHFHIHRGDQADIVCEGNRDDFARACEMFDNNHVQYPFRYDILCDDESLSETGILAFWGYVHAISGTHQGPNHIEIKLTLKIAARKEDA